MFFVAVTFPYTCSIEPPSFHSLRNSEQMGRQVIKCATAAESGRGLALFLPWVGAHQSKGNLLDPNTAHDFAARGRPVQALSEAGSAREGSWQDGSESEARRISSRRGQQKQSLG